MPAFPRYESKGVLTTQAPSVQAVANTEGQIQENNAKIGQQVSDTAVKWTNALDTIQSTVFEANTKSALADIQLRASADPDINSMSKYQAEIKKVKEDNLKGFASKSAESMAGIKFNYDSKVADINLQNIFKKKAIDVGQVATFKLIDAQVQNPNADSLKVIQNKLAEQVGAGLIDRADAYKLEQKADKDIKFNSFLRDFRNDPVGAEKQFNENSYGLDIETAEKARSKLKELKVLQREQEGNVYGDMSLRVSTGQLPENEIDAMVAANKANPNEGITEKHGNELKKALYRDVTQRIGAKEFKKYKKAIDFVFSSSAQDKVKGYEAVLAAYTDGLTPDETNFLKKIIDTKKDVVFANKAAAGKKMIEQIFGARAKNVQTETQALLAYAGRIANGVSPEQAAQETAIDIIQTDHPATIADPALIGAFTPKKGFKNIPKVKNESSSGRQE